ncbi:MAG: type II toxin-antitoxin system VapC family toxin [Lewinellaceae bacterium]|nr:type II toxin-antitoxin system VapC family toxin [Lewinellaceae bacterium]
MILCDTNIFIHAFNGNVQTIEELNQIGHENIALSTITVMELFQGMGNKRELEIMKKKIRYYDFIEIDIPVSKLALELVERFNLSHGLKIPDAIIAATAVVHQIELHTYNVKDFRFVPDIRLYEVK